MARSGRWMKQGAQCHLIPTSPLASHFKLEVRHLSQKEKEQKRQRTLQCSSVTLYMSQGKLCNYTLSQLLL